MDEAKTRYGNTQWEVGKVFPYPVGSAWIGMIYRVIGSSAGKRQEYLYLKMGILHLGQK